MPVSNAVNLLSWRFYVNPDFVGGNLCLLPARHLLGGPFGRVVRSGADLCGGTLTVL
jgi:hypothetical protein